MNPLWVFVWPGRALFSCRADSSAAASSRALARGRGQLLTFCGFCCCPWGPGRDPPGMCPVPGPELGVLPSQELPGGQPPGQRGPAGGRRAGPLLPRPERGTLRGHLEHAGPEGAWRWVVLGREGWGGAGQTWVRETGQFCASSRGREGRALRCIHCEPRYRRVRVGKDPRPPELPPAPGPRE